MYLNGLNIAELLGERPVEIQKGIVLFLIFNLQLIHPFLYPSRTLISFHPFSVKTGGSGKSLALFTSRCILFNGENISFDSSLVLYIYIYSNNIPPIMIINRVYENQNLLPL